MLSSQEFKEAVKTLPVAFLLLTTNLSAHTWKADNGLIDREVLRAHILEEWKREHFEVASTASTLQLAAAAVANAAAAPATAKAFLPFTKLDLRADGEFLYVGSNGMPDHGMMVGITAWQQQVPLPQNYMGDNAWRLPLKPVPAKEPAMIKGRFLRGAIALAVNGIPIFNPQNNRGEISYEIGELDQWGGHCGRADDYHYHITPLHLQMQAGKGMPVAYALDGYPIYGLTEPDGSPVGKLDECHGHESSSGYHYHASMKYPYVIGGFHGEVVEAGEQVDPQPRAQSVREALPALRNAEITGFESTGNVHYKLSYNVNGDKRSVSYAIKADGTYPFEFDNGSEGKAKEVYTSRGQGGGQGRPPRGPEGQGKGKGERPPRPKAAAQGIPDMNGAGGGRSGRQETFVAQPDQSRSSDGKFMLSSPVVEDLKNLPVEFTGDGVGISPPVEWMGAPASTRSYALIMDHVAPGGDKKWYWIVYDIPASATSLPKDSQSIGKIGTGFKGQVGYEPPHSKGPGAKTYVITLYALAGALEVRGTPGREELLAAMKGKVLASSSLRVVYSSGGAE